MNQEGQKNVRKRAASGLVGEQVLGDGQKGRVLQGRVEKYRDVSTDLVHGVQTATRQRGRKKRRGGYEANAALAVVRHSSVKLRVGCRDRSSTSAARQFRDVPWARTRALFPSNHETSNNF